jgi:TRAP-type C4-dicarboxylate transport system substrate-binding protein
MLAIAALGLSSCASDETASGASAGGEGVDFGATLEEYQAAFADVDPITLNTQVPAPQGSPITKNYEDYFAAVEEWSDGKITFEVAWSNAVAPATETDDALADGRLDMGLVMAGYEPDKYPVYAALSDTSFMGNGNPLEMIMTPHGYIPEIVWDNEQVQQEFEQAGLKLLTPSFTGGVNSILCGEQKTTLDELKGGQVRISGAAHAAEAKALGMSPVSLTFEEVYEALQRGVLDCAFAGITVVRLADLLSVAPHVVLSSEADFAQVPSTLAMSTPAWESLPLVAQQLLFDRLDVFVQSNMDSLVGLFRDVLGEVDGKGGSIAGLDAEAQVALDEGNDAFLRAVAENKAIEDGEALVEAIRTKSAEWRELVGKLGYDTEVEYADFPEWASENEIDLTAFMEKVTEVQNQVRPE